MNLRPLYRGDSRRLKITFTLNNVPLVITGGTVKFTVKNDINDSYANAIIKKSTSTFIDNSCYIDILPADTIALTEGNIFVYDIELTDVNGYKTTVDSGEFPIILDVTNG